MDISLEDIEDMQKRDDKAALEQVATECYRSLAVFCRTFFPRRFRLPFTRSHHMLMEVLDDRTVSKIVCTAFRGFGKTSIVNIGLMAREILYRDKRFIPYIGKTAKYAEMQTENLKRALISSREVKGVFGSIKTRRVGVMDETFSKMSWVASLPGSDYKTLILPRGAGQQIQGLLFDNYRPDLFQIDDLEDRELVMNKEWRQKIADWFFGEVTEAVQQAEENDVQSRIIYTDTVKHHDALILKVMEQKDWVSLRIPLCDDDYKTLVPGFISDEKIKEKVEGYRARHQLNVFAREFQCRPVSKEGASFKEDMFLYYNENDEDFVKHKHLLRNILIVDPAKTSNPDACETAFVVWGISSVTNKLYFRKGVGLNLHPDEQYEMAFSIAKTFGIRVIAVEVTGLNEYASHNWMNAAIQRGLHFQWLWLNSKRLRLREDVGLSGEEGAKAVRVASLIPLYRQGQILHNKEESLSYETQLIQYPRPKKWDICDAAGYITQIMEEHAEYFTPLNEGDDPYEYKDEYEGIWGEYEDRENEAVRYFV